MLYKNSKKFVVVAACRCFVDIEQRETVSIMLTKMT